MTSYLLFIRHWNFSLNHVIFHAIVTFIAIDNAKRRRYAARAAPYFLNAHHGSQNLRYKQKSMNRRKGEGSPQPSTRHCTAAKSGIHREWHFKRQTSPRAPRGGVLDSAARISFRARFFLAHVSSAIAKPRKEENRESKDQTDATRGNIRCERWERERTDLSRDATTVT